MRDSLGDRMKADYENRTRYMLPRRTWTVIRLDGRAFHTYTRGLDRPFDQKFMDDMIATATYLCEQISGCLLGYTQSDEISLVVGDFANPKTQAWFDGNLQKIVSISASTATAKFNALRGSMATFDSRAFTIPSLDEVINYLIWRQQDATRNSIQMAGQAHFSHRELHQKTCNHIQEMLFREHGVNWSEYPESFKNGTLVFPEELVTDVEYLDKRTGESRRVEGVTRRVWRSAGSTPFTRNRDGLAALLGGS